MALFVFITLNINNNKIKTLINKKINYYKVELLEAFTGSAFLVVREPLDYEREVLYSFELAAYGCGEFKNSFSPRLLW